MSEERDNKSPLDEAHPLTRAMYGALLKLMQEFPMITACGWVVRDREHKEVLVGGIGVPGTMENEDHIASLLVDGAMRVAQRQGKVAVDGILNRQTGAWIERTVKGDDEPDK